MFAPLRTTVARHHSLPSTHQKVPFHPIKAPIQRSESSVPDGIHINHVGVYRFYTDKGTFITVSFRKPMPATPPNSLLKGRINRSTYKESRKKILSFSSYPITTSKSLFFHIYMWNDILIICFQFHVQIPKALLLFSSKI